jgi:REP element-mobilizing transposase RayT
MPRKPRLHYQGALYHVIARGNNRQSVFTLSEDYTAFLRYIRQIKAKKPFLLYAFCLMPNHLHLLIEVKTTPLSVIMQRLLTGYTVHYNHRHKKHGHLFQGRYKAILCEKDSYLLELVRYIHLNPVRAKLVNAPGAWKWCGHSILGGHVEEPLIDEEPVLALFSGKKHSARAEYRAFVRDGLNMGHRQDIYPEEKAPFLGEEEYVHEHIIRHEEMITAVTPGMKKAIVTLPDILNDFSKNRGIKAEIVKGNSRKEAAAKVRREFILEAYKAGHTTVNIARFINRDSSYVSRVIDIGS